MKKSLFTLAAVAAVMASCSNDELKVDNGQAQNGKELGINFGTYAQKATRAAENSTETQQLGLIAHHSTFVLWGYKDVQTAYVFGTEPTGTETTSTAGQLVSGTAGSAAVYYTQAEIDAAAIVATMTINDYKEPGVQYTQDEIDAANVIKDKTTNDIKVAATEDSWTYTPMRFWDKNSNNYEFYAAAPQTTAAPKWTLNKNTNAQGDDYFTLADVTLSNSTLASTSYVESMKGQSNTDYMIASPKKVLLANYGEAVELDFNHILSRLNVTVRKGTKLNAAGEDGKLAITSLTVYNMPGKGSFDEHAVTVAATLAAGTDARWTAATGNDAVVINYTGNALADVPYVDGQTVKLPSYILQALIMPQTVGYNATVTKDGKWDADNNATTDKVALGTTAAPYIKLVYAIGKDNPETYTAYYNLASLFGSTDLKFSEGWQNTLNITIDADAITFKAKTYNWEDTTAGALSIQ